MNKLVYTYALIKSFHEQQNDYIGAFCPMILKILQSNEYTENVIQNKLKDKFDFKIPLHIQRTILQRLLRHKFIIRKNERYKLTKAGAVFLKKFKKEDVIQRRLNTLFDDFNKYLNEKLGEPIDLDQTQEIIVTFIHKNIEPVLEFFVKQSTPDEFNKYSDEKADRDEEKCLIEYIQITKERKPYFYEILMELIFGSLISLVFSFEKPLEIRNEKFKPTQVYLDTNILLSLLNLHFKEFGKPAIELHALLKKYNFEIKVFDFTIQEITRVLNKCILEHREYPSDIKVNSICANLEKQNMTKQDLEIFISNINEKILDLEIEIEWTHTEVENYEPGDKKIRDKMRKFKPTQPEISQNHDILAIEKIKEIRKHTMRRIEDSKAIFLTSDGNLSKFNFFEMGHRADGTVCEVVLDRFLTSILWLKHPDVELSLDTLIASCYRENFFINVRIWERFYDTLQELKKNKEITEKDISSLLYYDYIEDILCNIDEKEADKITQEFVLIKTKEAKEVTQILDKKTKKTEEQIKKQRQEIEILKTEIKEVNQKKIDAIKIAVEVGAEKKVQKQRNEIEILKTEIKEINQENADLNKKTIEIKEMMNKQHQKLNDLTQNMANIYQYQENIKEQLKMNMKKLAIRYSYVLATFITILLFLIVYEVHLLSITYNVPNILVYGVPIVIGGTGIYEIWSNLRSIFEKKILKIFCRKKLENMGFNERDIEDKIDNYTNS